MTPQEGLKFGATALTFSNRHFDPVDGSRLYNEYLEEYVLAEEVRRRRHHAERASQRAVLHAGERNMFAAILAAMTKRVKIVLLGNPLPLADNPMRLAEELAMIDMISKGRLVSGFVRGGGQEQLANGVNPAYNRERFVEAHDLIQKIWTEPGPFRWEGNALSASRGESLGDAAAEAVSARVDSRACCRRRRWSGRRSSAIRTSR